MTFWTDAVAPNVKRLMGARVAKSLALPLLWAALEPEEKHAYPLLPNALRTRIRQACTTTDINPVARVLFYVAGNGQQLQLIEIQSSPDLDFADITGKIVNGNGTSVRRPQSTSIVNHTGTEMAALHSQLSSLRRGMLDIMNKIQRARSSTSEEIQKVAMSVKRIAIQPVVRPASSMIAENPAHVQQTAAILLKRPKDLYQLWHEFQFGCNGAKPAKDFSREERGANKFAYSRRKVFWDVVSGLVRSGFTSDSAIDKVYDVFGRSKPVTSILVSLRQQRTNGLHPSLRVGLQ